MQIELIGCTSAGKSSLVRNILQSNHQNGLNLVTSYDFVLSWINLDWIKSHGLRMLCLNLTALLACILTLRKNFEFYRFVIAVILRLPAKVGFIERLRIGRISARNIGIYEIVCRFAPDQQIVLADEGTLHIANYLFVHVSAEPNMAELEKFVRLVSIPDVVVYVKQPESVLITRTKARNHKRIPGGSPILIKRFIHHSLAVFEKLVGSSSLESRLLVLNQGQNMNTVVDYSDNPLLAFARKIIPIEEMT